MLGALDRPTSGSIELDGQDLATMREGQLCGLRTTSIGFIFQTFNLIRIRSSQDLSKSAPAPRPAVITARQAR
jgi:putative ABC transport system ATP-binding protein